MTTKRVDFASRVIKASAQSVYRALLDRESLVSWLPPRGMTGEIQRFEPRVGGRFRIVLTHQGERHAQGKSSDRSDVVDGRFVELVPNARVAQIIEFASDAPEFAGPMTVAWSLAPAATGTDVAITCENVPHGISQEDHAVGLASSLENLAAFVERRIQR